MFILIFYLFFNHLKYKGAPATKPTPENVQRRHEIRKYKWPRTVVTETPNNQRLRTHVLMLLIVEFARFAELEVFSQFVTDFGNGPENQLSRGPNLHELSKQALSAHLAVE